MLNSMTRRMGMGTALLLVAGLTATAGYGQNFSVQGVRSGAIFSAALVQPEVVPAPSNQPETSVSFAFPGGTLSQYAEAIRAAVQPRAVNIMAAGIGPEPILPAFELRGVSVTAAAKLPVQLVNGIIINILQGENGTLPVYAYSYMNARDEKKASNISTNVVSLRKVLERVPTDPADQRIAYDSQTVLSALESAAMMAEEETVAPVRIRFHTESSLLFVRGTPEQRDAVSRALMLLEKDVEARRISLGGGDARRMQNEIEQMELELTFAEEQLRSATKEHELLQTRYKEGMVSQSEVSAVEQKKTEKQAQFDMLKLRLEQSRVELKLYRPEAKTEAKVEPPKSGK